MKIQRLFESFRKFVNEQNDDDEELSDSEKEDAGEMAGEIASEHDIDLESGAIAAEEITKQEKEGEKV